MGQIHLVDVSGVNVLLGALDPRDELVASKLAADAGGRRFDESMIGRR